MEKIKKQLKELRAEIMRAIINLARKSCEVGMSGFQIRQSFSYYEEEVYHIDKIYINPDKGRVMVELYEYADSIPLSEFSIDDQVGICEELQKLFTNPKYRYRIDN